MSLLAINLTGGKTDAAMSLMPFGALFSNSGVLTSNAFQVSAQVSPGMSVKVYGATTDSIAVIKTTDGSTYFIKNTASANVTITANSSGVTKTDAIVAYVNLAGGDPNNAGSPGSVHLIAVRRAGVNTGAPTNGEIDTATGNNPWTKLSEITVINGETEITGAEITDTRLSAWLAPFFFGSANIPGSALASSAVTTPKLKPKTNYAKGTGAGNLTTTSNTYADLVTVLSYTAGTTNERLFIDVDGLFAVSGNTGLVILAATGTGVTLQHTSSARTQLTTQFGFHIQAVVDITAGNTATIKLQGLMSPSGTLTVLNTDTTNSTWYLRYVAYGNA